MLVVLVIEENRFSICCIREFSENKNKLLEIELVDLLVVISLGELVLRIFCVFFYWYYFVRLLSKVKVEIIRYKVLVIDFLKDRFYVKIFILVFRI